MPATKAPAKAVTPPTVTITKGAFWFYITVTAPGAAKVTLEREVGGVVRPVEGAQDILPISDTFSVYDFMAMQRVLHQYRAVRFDADPLNPTELQATAGSWTPTPFSSYLDYGSDVLFDAANPAHRAEILVEGIDTMKRSVSQNVVAVIGRPDPVVVSSVRRWPGGSIRLLTLTDAARRSLVDLLSKSNLLAFSPHMPGYGFDYVPFFAVGDVDESRVSPRGYEPARRWVLSVQEVSAPPLLIKNIEGGTPPGGGGGTTPPGGGGGTTPPGGTTPGTRVWGDYSSTKNWTDIDHTDWKTVAGL